MKKNVGNFDRIIRLIIAGVIGFLFFNGTLAIGSTIGIIAAVAGVIMAFTGLTSWCAIYSLVGLSTCSVDTAK